MLTHIVMATKSYLGMEHQVLDSSYSYSDIWHQIILACQSQFCIFIPNSMFRDVLLGAWNLLGWGCLRHRYWQTLSISGSLVLSLENWFTITVTFSPEWNSVGSTHGASTLFVTLLSFKEYLKQIWHKERLW